MRSDEMTKGITKVPHRSLLKSLGLVDEEMNKPFIGIANSYNETIPGHKHLRQLVESVKEGIRMAGGVPFEFNVIGVCDGLAMNNDGMSYSLASRQTICDSIITQGCGFRFDGIVFIPNCDKIVPAMLMAAANLDLPSIFISGGPMLKGKVGDQYVGLSEAFEAVGKYLNKQIDLNKLNEYEENACPTCGSCSGMYTANTMNCLCESLGIALKGNGTVPAVYSMRYRLAKEAGMKILDLVNKQVTFKSIVTKESILNAITLDMAMGGSTNSILHILAIANMLNYDITLDDFDTISNNTKQICKLSPASKYFIEDLNDKGGIYTVLKHLKLYDKLHNINTVYDKTLFELLDDHYYLPDGKVVVNYENAYLETGGLMVLKGNIAKDGAVVKVGAINDLPTKFVGEAIVFDSESECVEYLSNIKVESNKVIVIRNVGPKSGYGMPEMLTPTSLIKGLKLDNKVALITDGRFSGGSNGMVVGHICPESCEGGAIAYINDGDVIEINFATKELNNLNDITNRLPKQVFTKSTNYLSFYSKYCLNSSKGALIKYEEEK